MLTWCHGTVGTLHDMTPRRPIVRAAFAALTALTLTAAAACSSSDEGSTSNGGDSTPSATVLTTSSSVSASSPSTDTESLIESSSTAPATTSPATDQSDLDPSLVADVQAVLDGALGTLPSPDATVQAAVVMADSEVADSEVVWAATAGPDREIDRPFRMASVGKTFTAATVLRLVELGAIGLDDPIGALLTPETATVLESDGYDLMAITVARLLQHTSGLYDYAFGDGSPFLADALADRSRVWTRREQIELAVSVGEPLYAPGKGFTYSDTGYVLLGEIIEVETGQPYARAMRELLDFDRLDITHVWLESGEMAPTDLLPMSRSFFGPDEVSDLDFSLDAFGGGGLAGTTSDVARFFTALLGGEVFADPATLESMLAVPNTNIAREEFGVLLGDGAHGLFRMDLSGQTCWAHRGFLGTIALACPEAGVSLVVTTNTALTDPLPIAADLLGLVLAG